MFTVYKNKKISVFVPADDRTAAEKIADEMRETFGEATSRPGSDFYDAGAVFAYTVEIYAKLCYNQQCIKIDASANVLNTRLKTERK